MKKLTTEEFISKAKSIHGDTYNYSLVEYKNSKTKVKIICPTHGTFKQTPDKHINMKQGCLTCGGNKKLSLNEFISKSNKTHDNKYDYNLVKYINARTKVKIICPTHGTFKQTPNSHLQTHGCPQCKNILIHNALKSSLLDFVIIANKTHDNKYDYNLVKYINARTKVKIICPTHGTFKQTPNAHTRGQGCPKCKMSKGENKIKQWLTINNIDFKEQKKFKECKDKFYLPFDFYIPKQNICIEYDGEHHFNNIKYFGGIEKLKVTQQHDTIKNKYCHDNDIKLIRIPYTEFKNINSILENEIK